MWKIFIIKTKKKSLHAYLRLALKSFFFHCWKGYGTCIILIISESSKYKIITYYRRCSLTERNACRCHKMSLCMWVHFVCVCVLYLLCKCVLKQIKNCTYAGLLDIYAHIYSCNITCFEHSCPLIYNTTIKVKVNLPFSWSQSRSQGKLVVEKCQTTYRWVPAW